MHDGSVVGLSVRRVTQAKPLAPVVERVDSTTSSINHLALISWIAIYLVDSAIHPLNHWSQVSQVTLLLKTGIIFLIKRHSRSKEVCDLN